MREYEEESLTSNPPCCQNIPIFSRKIVGVGRFCHLWDKTNDKRNCFPKKKNYMETKFQVISILTALSMPAQLNFHIPAGLSLNHAKIVV